MTVSLVVLAFAAYKHGGYVNSLSALLLFVCFI